MLTASRENTNNGIYPVSALLAASGEDSLWHSSVQRHFQQFFCPLVGACFENQLPSIITVVGFKPSNWWLVSCALGQASLGSDSLATSLPPTGLHSGGTPSVTRSLSLLQFFMRSFYSSLCRRSSLRPPLFHRWNALCAGLDLVGAGGLRHSTLPSWTHIPGLRFWFLLDDCVSGFMDSCASPAWMHELFEA